MGGGQPQQQPDLSLPLRPNSRTTSAPTSPSKTRESLLQRVSSLTSSVVGRTVQTVQQTQQQFSDATNKISYNKDRCFNLLVIDDQNTDWCAINNMQSKLHNKCLVFFFRSKYFRGRKIQGDWDVRVEQAEFRELSVTASSESGAIVSMAVYRNGTKVVRF